MTIKTEHSGAKNGGGYYGTRIDAKRISKKLRRKGRTPKKDQVRLSDG